MIGPESTATIVVCRVGHKRRRFVVGRRGVACEPGGSAAVRGSARDFEEDRR